ncbi:MAG: ribosomal protein S18-alanine N-acetyltransferase [Mycobacteriaceae bacterium]
MAPADTVRCAALEQVLFPGDDPWTAEMFTAEIAAAHNHYVVARADSTVVGYAGIALLGRRSQRESEIHTIGVNPAHQGSGTGRALLAELLTVADAHGGPVFLEVRTDNDRALDLYAHHGFSVVATRRGYYRPSGADAFTMRREPVS